MSDRNYMPTLDERMIEKGFIGMKDAAQLAGVHLTTVNRWADSGVIESHTAQGWRKYISVASLRTYLEDRDGPAFEPARFEEMCNAFGC